MSSHFQIKIQLLRNLMRLIRFSLKTSMTIWYLWSNPVSMVPRIQQILQKWDTLLSSMFWMLTHYRRSQHMMIKLLQLVNSLSKLNILSILNKIQSVIRIQNRIHKSYMFWHTQLYICVQKIFSEKYSIQSKKCLQ